MSLWILIPIFGCMAIIITLWFGNKPKAKGVKRGNSNSGLDVLGNPTRTLRAGDKKKVKKDNREVRRGNS